MRISRDILIALTIAAITLAVYWQATAFDFVNYDDPRYVSQNQRVLDGLSIDNVKWAFSTFEFSNWHPLTWLSLMLDSDVHRGRPGGYHLTSILLHALNAGLLMLLLSRLTGALWRSALVAALFALHPLHVESVAWISERKDVLSACFVLLAMLAYLRFARRGRSLTAYLLVVLCFAASLMSKPMIVTLPFVLLLLDWWPLNRVRSRSDWPRLILEKLPLMAMSIASSIVTILAQRGGGAVRDFAHTSLPQRMVNAVVAYGEYLWQTIWPANLAVFYPYEAPIAPSRVALAVCALIAISVACAIASRKGNRAALVGWLWFLGTMVPVIGLVQVGAQSHADRYTYVPLIGVFIMLAWSLPASPRLRRLSCIAAAAYLAAMSAVTWMQIGYWRDSATLASRALDVTSNNATAHVLLANALLDDNEIDAAIAHLEQATSIDPHSWQAWHNLGFAYAQAGRIDDAITAYQQSIARRPDFAENHFNLGLLFRQQNRIDEARAALQRAADAAADAGDEGLRARARDELNRLPR